MVLATEAQFFQHLLPVESQMVQANQQTSLLQAGQQATSTKRPRSENLGKKGKGGPGSERGPEETGRSRCQANPEVGGCASDHSVGLQLYWVCGDRARRCPPSDVQGECRVEVSSGVGPQKDHKAPQRADDGAL